MKAIRKLVLSEGEKPSVDLAEIDLLEYMVAVGRMNQSFRAVTDLSVSALRVQSHDTFVEVAEDDEALYESERGVARS